jgi:hypothetical protein
VSQSARSTSRRCPSDASVGGYGANAECARTALACKRPARTSTRSEPPAHGCTRGPGWKPARADAAVIDQFALTAPLSVVPLQQSGSLVL